MQSECITLLHITHGIKLGHPIYKDILKYVALSIIFLLCFYLLYFFI